MVNTSFLFISDKLQVEKVFLSSSQHYDIIVSDVILIQNILRECIALLLRNIIKGIKTHATGSADCYDCKVIL